MINKIRLRLFNKPAYCVQENFTNYDDKSSGSGEIESGAGGIRTLYLLTQSIPLQPSGVN
jgi:hypothetical protein